MGNKVCETCETIQPAFSYIQTRAFRSIEQMQTKFKKYAEDNLLSLYGRRMQMSIEKLFTFQQFHLCDLLIKLSCEKKTEELQELLQDIQQIDFQQLDHLTLIQNVPTHIVEHIGNVSTLYYNQQKQQQNGLKTLQAKNIKNKEFADQHIRDMLQANRFAIVATVECLGNTGAFDKLKLPSKKSSLQLFVQKVQAINSRYQCAILVVFIVNPKFQKQFEHQIDKLLRFRDFQQSGDTETTLTEFKYEKIIYKPPYPCVNQERKIVLQDRRIRFDQYNGDFVGFFMKQSRLQLIMQRFEYLQIANIGHLIQGIADRDSLIYLHSHPETHIVAHARPENQLTGKREYIKVRKNFVERMKFTNYQHQPKSQYYSLSQTYYIKAELFFQKEKHVFYHKLISARIKSSNFTELGIVFTRNFDNVLYAPITLIIIDEDNQIFSQNNKQVGYSNFCKTVLGIKDTVEEQVIEVCPQLLFGPREQLKKVIKKLKSLPQIGFPLVVNKQKIEEMPAIQS